MKVKDDSQSQHAAKPEKILVYCGLNQGNSFSRIFHFFDKAIGFEPVPELYNDLVNRFQAYPHVHIVQAALTDYVGTINFNLHDYGPANSIGILREDWKQQHERDIKVLKSITVPCLHLGNYLQKNNIQEIDTVITDIQGYDLCVVKTLEYYIKNRLIRCLTCEVQRDTMTPVYENVPSNRESDFTSFLGTNYDFFKRKGKASDNCHDITWLRKGERDTTVYLDLTPTQKAWLKFKRAARALLRA